MQSINECFDKVKRDYLKFLNKERIYKKSTSIHIKNLKKIYIPIAFWYLSIFGGLGILAYAISRIKGYSKYRTLDRLYRGIIDIVKVKRIIKERENKRKNEH